MKNNRILIVIPDGIGIRNYLYSDIITNLSDAGFQIIVMHNLGKDLIQLVNKQLKTPIKQLDFISFKESKYQTFLREVTTYARLKKGAIDKENSTILSNWKTNNLGFGKKMFLNFSKLFGNLLNSYESILLFESRVNQLWKSSKAFHHYQNIIDEVSPDLIFITHQRVPSLAPLCIAATSRKVKTISAIFSWDNLPKARLPIRTDYYALWSDYMLHEFLDFYPEIKPEQLYVTGTPQFDFYTKENLLISRKEFAEKYHLDSQKKWVLFSGDDVMTSPHDPNYLEDVAEALSLEDDIQILFRQVPISTPERYQHVLNRYSNITHIPPIWNKGNSWESFFPLYEDIQLLMNLCYHCGTVLNIGSTMALDFSFFDKPGIFLKYDTCHDSTWSTSEIYKYEHFKSMAGLDAVILVENKSEISSKVHLALNSPESVAKDRSIWKDRIVKNKISSSIEFVNLFKSLNTDPISIEDEKEL